MLLLILHQGEKILQSGYICFIRHAVSQLTIHLVNHYKKQNDISTSFYSAITGKDIAACIEN